MIATLTLLLSLLSTAHAAPDSELAQQCMDSLLGLKPVLCQYKDLPQTIEGNEGEVRTIEDGVVCLGHRQENNEKPFLVILEKQRSIYEDESGNPITTENIIPQYIYDFKKAKESSRNVLLHERAKWLSQEAERDTLFQYKRHSGAGELNISFFYKGRLLNLPYQQRSQRMDCSEIH